MSVKEAAEKLHGWPWPSDKLEPIIQQCVDDAVDDALEAAAMKVTQVGRIREWMIHRSVAAEEIREMKSNEQADTKAV